MTTPRCIFCHGPSPSSRLTRCQCPAHGRCLARHVNAMVLVKGSGFHCPACRAGIRAVDLLKVLRERRDVFTNRRRHAHLKQKVFDEVILKDVLPEDLDLSETDVASD